MGRIFVRFGFGPAVRFYETGHERIATIRQKNHRMQIRPRPLGDAQGTEGQIVSERVSNRERRLRIDSESDQQRNAFGFRQNESEKTDGENRKSTEGAGFDAAAAVETAESWLICHLFIYKFFLT